MRNRGTRETLEILHRRADEILLDVGETTQTVRDVVPVETAGGLELAAGLRACWEAALRLAEVAAS